jgi:hypothetical protein
MRKSILTSCVILYAFYVHGQTTQKENAEQVIRQLSNDWMMATKTRDEPTLNKIVAPEFTLSGNDLTEPPLSRNIWMKNTMENLKIDSISYSNMRIQVIDQVAIVHSSLYWSVSFRDMPARKDTVTLVDTWLKRGQSWQVVSRIVSH